MTALDTWPRITSEIYDPERVVVDVVAGYATLADIPYQVRQAVMLHVGQQYRFPEAVTDKAVRPLPHGLMSLARAKRIDMGARKLLY